MVEGDFVAVDDVATEDVLIAEDRARIPFDPREVWYFDVSVVYGCEYPTPICYLPSCLTIFAAEIDFQPTRWYYEATVEACVH